MKLKITSKEVTLALGVIVALIMAMTLWVNDPAEQPSILSFTPSKIPFTAAVEHLFKSAVSIIL